MSDIFNIFDDEVQPGYVLCELHCHETTRWGKAGAYTSHDPFPIDRDTYEVMISKTPVDPRMVMNKFAVVISATESVDGEASAILVVYAYDHSYYCGMLFADKYFSTVRPHAKDQ
jgi:hypothetical protein